MADISELIDYYANLLIIQYHNKPKAKATIEAIIKELFIDGLIDEVRDAYNFETAVGAQLDVVAKYIGIDRNYKGQDLSGYFSFIAYDEVDSPPATRTGFAEYSNFEAKEGKFLTYSNTLSQDLQLNDDDFRFLLKLKIVQNNINHSHKEIDDAIFKFFGTDVRADSEGNMRMFYFIPKSRTELIKVAIEKDLLPRPIGVGLNYVVEKSKSFFGFATYNKISPLITGFTTYSEYDTKEGEMLKYNKLIKV